MGSNLKKLKKREAERRTARRVEGMRATRKRTEPQGKEFELCEDCGNKMNALFGTENLDGDGTPIDMADHERAVVEMVRACPTCSRNAKLAANDKMCTRCRKPLPPSGIVPSSWATLLSFRGGEEDEEVMMWATLCPECIGHFQAWCDAAPTEAAAPAAAPAATH